MAHESHHEEFELLLVDEGDDRVDWMTGNQVGLKRNTGGCACALAASITGTRRWFASAFSSSTSSIVARKRGSSSTVTM
jgi:hypothetical protein